MATNKRELMANAQHWLDQAKQGGLKRFGIGAIFIFFDQTGEGTAVCTSTVDRQRLKQELKTILRKMEERVIVSPYEN